MQRALQIHPSLATPSDALNCTEINCNNKLRHNKIDLSTSEGAVDCTNLGSEKPSRFSLLWTCPVASPGTDSNSNNIHSTGGVARSRAAGHSAPSPFLSSFLPSPVRPTSRNTIGIRLSISIMPPVWDVTRTERRRSGGNGRGRPRPDPYTYPPRHYPGC